MAMGVALAAGTTLLSLTAYLAVDLLGDIRADIKELGASTRADIKELGAKVDATQAKIDALVQEQVISRLTRLEDARLLRK